METPIVYTPKFIEDADRLYDELWNGLEWVRVDKTPRREYYCNEVAVPYTYNAKFPKTYHPQPWTPAIIQIKNAVEVAFNTYFEVCFLNGYENSKDQLGWHADDSPEMDDTRSIAIVSLGAEREIWFCPQGDKSQVERIRLGHGSLCLMAPGMQDTHFHRIPKADREVGPRVSLTFRGYVNTCYEPGCEKSAMWGDADKCVWCDEHRHSLVAKL